MLDYDVVIIGDSLAARWAALKATHLQARVALVEPMGPDSQVIPPHRRSLALSLRSGQILSELARQSQQARFVQHLKSGFQENWFQNEAPLPLDEAVKWVAGVASQLEADDSLAQLAASGVDVILGNGQFMAKPRLAFAVNDRLLRSRSYLLALSSHSTLPAIEGLESTGYLTEETFAQSLRDRKLPQSLVVIGGSPGGIELAQALARLGVRVTVIVKSTHILGKEDPEIARLIQAVLEAEGIRILTQTEVTQAIKIEGKKWVQAGDEAIETDEILVSVGQFINLKSLNLEAANVRLNERGLLILNDKLQTTNPSIYACGDALGGYPFVHFAKYEAQIALKNALFFPWFRVDYRGVPWAIFTNPQVARVGLTEAQARRRYGDKIIVSRDYFKSIDRAQMQGETTGFCKLVGRPNGEILGASLVGVQASELIHTIALAIRQGIKLGAIADLPHIWLSLSEINGKTADLWQQKRFLHHTPSANFLENWFHWSRYWSRK